MASQVQQTHNFFVQGDAFLVVLRRFAPLVQILLQQHLLLK